MTPSGPYFSCVLLPGLCSAQLPHPVIPFLYTKLCSGLREKPKSSQWTQMAQMICPRPITSLSFCPLHLLTVFKLHGPPRYSSKTPGPLLPEGFALALLSAWDANLHLPTWPAALSLSNPFSNLTLSTRPTWSMPFNKEICLAPHSTPPHPWHFESLLLCFNYFPQRIYHLLAYL